VLVSLDEITRSEARLPMNLAHAADLAYAASAPPGGGGGPAAFVQPLILFGAMFAIFYFIVLRPQQRQKADRERMLAAVKKGDRVVTTSGMHGTVVSLAEHTVTLRVADQVKLEFDRTAIGRVAAVTGDKDA
jgi:preprotein translocase subunit YajC